MRMAETIVTAAANAIGKQEVPDCLSDVDSARSYARSVLSIVLLACLISDVVMAYVIAPLD